VNKPIQLINAVFIALLFSGCMVVDTPKGQYVLTTQGMQKQDPVTDNSVTDNNKSSAKPLSLSRADKAWAKATGYCGRHGRLGDPVPWTSITMTLNQDIDVVYPKIMREFGYQRRKPIIDPDTGHTMCAVHIRYVEVVGSHYQMRGYITHSFGNELEKNTIEVDLAKEGQNKVRVQLSYYSGHTIDKPGYQESLKQRLLNALK
jgi:hypothetical protein